MSEVYLIHLFAPVNPDRPARHYLGFAENTAARVANYRKHRQYFHSRLMFAAVERGIDFEVARVWKHCTKRDEKLLRDLKNNPRLCPICNPSLELATALTISGRYATRSTRDPKRIRYGDLDTLRGRVLRPAKPRVRNDGTLNQPEPIEPFDPVAARERLRQLSPAAAQSIEEAEAREFNRLITAITDNAFAEYGFDAEPPF